MTETTQKKRGRPAAENLPPLDPTADLFAVLYRTGASDKVETVATAGQAEARARELAAARGVPVFVFGPPTAVYEVAAVNVRKPSHQVREPSPMRSSAA